MYGGCPPWGEFTGLPHHVRVDCTDTGDRVWVQIGRFVGTDPDDDKYYDDNDISVVPDPGAEPDAVVAGPAAALTPGSGGAVTTPRSRIQRRPAAPTTTSGRPSAIHRRRGRGSGRMSPGQLRWTAPVRSAASATAASRAALVSCSVRVRSGARKRSANASDFLPAPDLVAVVDVEQPDRLQQLARAFAQRGLDVGDRHRLVDDERDVLLGERVASRTPGRGRRRRPAAAAGRGRSRPRRCAAAAPNAWHTRGCSSPAWPSVLAADPQPRRTGRGATASGRPGGTSTSTPSSAPSRRTSADRVRPAGLATLAPPAGALALAGEHHREVQRLVGDGLEQLGRARRRVGRQSTP